MNNFQIFMKGKDRINKPTSYYALLSTYKWNKWEHKTHFNCFYEGEFEFEFT